MVLKSIQIALKNQLHTPIEYLKGVGPQKAKVLNSELNIFNFEDLLSHYPFRYIDRSQIYKIADISENLAHIQVEGRIAQVKEVGTGSSKRLSATLIDDTGSLELVWFKGINWIKKILIPGHVYLVFGKANRFGSSLNMAHPEIERKEIAKKKNVTTRLQPVYNTTDKMKKRGIESKQIAAMCYHCLLEVAKQIEDFIPNEYAEKLSLLPRAKAITQIHFPNDLKILEQAQYTLKIEELLLLQLKLLLGSNARKMTYKGYVLPKIGSLFNDFYHNRLPFELTNAQKRVVKEIHHNIKSGEQMNRLVQGDVGSGKTLVALLCMLMVADNGMQSTLMAPTEILAQQHYQSIAQYLAFSNVKVALLTGSTKQSERKVLHNELEEGVIHILIGTHALIEDKVKFKSLGLVVIDEQHRFGVAQRAKLWEKSKLPPHVLVMTATPIPRTLAMTLYGDLDTSVIDELPPGRKPIITRWVNENKRLQVFGFLQEQLNLNRQVYVVYPLIEESETLDLQNLMDGFEAISRTFQPPKYQVSIVHGRMKPAEKEAEMQRFKQHKTHIMVATTVIEVGVDVPNATTMVIQNAERFGLSQLHQLRGRVGRGGDQSFCILITGNKLSKEGKKRMETMVATNDGFKISEVDLEIRGPGEISGTQQSGLPNLKIANLVSDHKELTIARKMANNILDADPKLLNSVNYKLRLQLKRVFTQSIDWGLIS